MNQAAIDRTKPNPEVARALLGLLYKNAPLGSIVIITVALILYWLQRGLSHPVWAAVWLAYMVLAALGRYLLARAYHRREIPSNADSINNDTARWRMRFRLGLCASCAGWVATLFLFLPSNMPAYQLTTATVLAGMAAGGVGVLSSDRVSTVIMIVSTVLLGSLVMFTINTPITIGFGLMGILISIGLGNSANNMHMALLEALYLADEKSRIVNALETANQSIAQNNILLENEINERIKVESALVNAKDAAEAANRAKSAFLANMSHELRTPLNGVVGFVDLLSTSPLNAEQQQQVQMIKTSADALHDVISDVLDFSKIEAGRMTLHIGSVAITPLLTSSMDIVRPKATTKSLDLILNIAPDMPSHIKTDAVKLRQVLLNFLGNAVKFSLAGEVTLTATFTAAFAKSTNATSGTLTLVIRDTGIGMTDETLAKIFQPFTQADNSDTRRFGGTGLGLSISKQLIALMNGTLTLESQTGVGTVVTVCLPVEV
jgi:signal transduction histidine kinase